MIGCIFEGVEFIGSFDGIHCFKNNFSGSKGAVINPQTLRNYNLSYSNFADVTFDGSFDGIEIDNVNFKGSAGAVIDPSTVKNRNISHSNFKDVNKNYEAYVNALVANGVAQGTNSTTFGGSCHCTNATKGKTYRVLCTHYAIESNGTEHTVANQSEEFVYN